MESSTPNTQGESTATRRAFLGTATALTAASYQRVMGANNRLGVGFIGFGLIGKQHVTDFKKMNDIDIVGMCDAYKPRVAEALSFIGNPKTQGYSDFRKMLDNKDIQGVVVATPDHWHALLTIMACAAGKDVYCEKPLTLFIDEGKWMLQAARKNNRIVTVGTQRRQGAGVKAAKKVIDSGVLGKIHSVRMSGVRNIYPGFGKTPVTKPPADFDYDMWLGPAPNKPYQKHRGLYHFRWFWDFSGGQMTNLAAHLIDQVYWLMNTKGPTMAMSTGGRFALEDDGETPDVQQATWLFRDNWIMDCVVREANGMTDPSARNILFLGTKGNLSLAGNYTITSETKIDPVNDIPKFVGHPIGGPIYTDVKPTAWLPQYPLASPPRGSGVGARGAAAPAAPAAPKAPAGGVASDPRYGTGGEDTMMMNERDWVDCMRSRKKPLCELEEGHRVAVASNLANMSLRLGRAIHWDPDKEVVIGDKEAQAACVRPYRAPWDKVLRSIVTV
jgi:predicted dehydrogenase